jgi:molecular chaperone DnaJ
MSKRDYYEVLGLNKDASEKDIKKSFRSLSKEYHPDKGGDEEKFKEINEAYSILSDSKKKESYDRFGHDEPNNYNGGNDAFDMIRRMQEQFQQQYRQQTRSKPTGQAIRLNVKLTLEEMFTGIDKTFKYNRNISCTDCDGTGGHDITTCSHCNGTGIMYKIFRTPSGMVQEASVCAHCNGQGKTYKTECKKCKGAGIISYKDEITFTIPKGINNGDNMVISEKGHSVKNGIPGDLIIVITEIKHEVFNRYSGDLEYIKIISYEDAILGLNIEVPTIEGNKIKLDIPPYSDNETILRLKGQGMSIHNSNQRGDMYIKVNVKLPKEINDDEKELLIKIKEIKEKLENVKNN